MSTSGKFRYCGNILKGVEIHNPTILEASLQPLANQFKQEKKSVYIFEYNSVFASQTYIFNKIFEPKVHYLSVNNLVVQKHLNGKYNINNGPKQIPWTLDHLVNHKVYDFENESLFKNLKNPVVISGSNEKTPGKNYAFLRGWIFGYFFDTNNIINRQMKKLDITDQDKVNELIAKEQHAFYRDYNIKQTPFDDKIKSHYKQQLDKNSHFLEILDLTYSESMPNKNGSYATLRKYKGTSPLFTPRLLSYLSSNTIGIDFFNEAKNLNNPTEYDRKNFELLYDTNKIVITHADTALRVLSKRYNEMATKDQFRFFDSRSKFTFRMEMIYDIEVLSFISPKNPSDYTLLKKDNASLKFSSTEDIRNGNVLNVFSYDAILAYLKKAYPKMRVIERVAPADITFKNYVLDGPVVIMSMKPSQFFIKNRDKVDLAKFREVLGAMVSKPKCSILENLTFLAPENIRKEIEARVDLDYYSKTSAIDMDKEKFFELFELYSEITSKWNVAYEHMDIDVSDIDDD